MEGSGDGHATEKAVSLRHVCCTTNSVTPCGTRDTPGCSALGCNRRWSLGRGCNAFTALTLKLRVFINCGEFTDSISAYLFRNRCSELVGIHTYLMKVKRNVERLCGAAAETKSLGILRWTRASKIDKKKKKQSSRSCSLQEHKANRSAPALLPSDTGHTSHGLGRADCREDGALGRALPRRPAAMLPRRHRVDARPPQLDHRRVLPPQCPGLANASSVSLVSVLWTHGLSRSPEMQAMGSQQSGSLVSSRRPLLQVPGRPRQILWCGEGSCRPGV